MSRDSERRMREAMNAAERASQRKSDFLSSVSHEIRTPLNTVLGMVELLGETSLDARQQRYVHTLRRASEHLLTLIDEVLDLTRIEAGRVTLDEARFDLGELVEGAIEIVRIHARRKRLDLEWKVAPDVPRTLRGDAPRLRQVLVNLLGNAVKFTDHGRVWLDVTVEKNAGAAGQGVALTFTVGDTGIGIHRERLSAIFDGFVQGDQTIARRFGGFGLGLHISKNIVERMGGSLQVESELGAGSRFALTVPLAIERASGRPHAGSAGNASRLHLRGPGSARLRVLIVDDSEDNRTLLGEYLNGAGAESHFADDGASAIGRVTTERFDVVIMDLQMPELDGFETTREILRVLGEHGRAAPPIVALSAHAVDKTLERGMAAGCRLVLTKPIRKRAFLEGVARAVGGTVAELHGRARDDVSALLPQYFTNRRRDVEVIDRALEEGDWDVVARLAHNMRGTGQSFGFPAITELGGSLEAAALSRNATEARGLHATLRALIARLDADAGGPKHAESGLHSATRGDSGAWGADEPPTGTGKE